MEVLRLENVSKYYTSKSGVVMGLSSINLSFKVGEFVAITGESGSGKSTMAHILGGIIPYESGEMYIYGTPTSHYGSSDWEHYRRDYVSFISQNYGILVGNTVLENVESALRFGGMEKEETRKRALEILEEVDLLEFKSRKAGKLSSGQKQRLSIARALAKPSKVLIADEPTGNLDRENSEKVIKLLHKASKDRLVILITHEFSEAEDYATRRIILSDAVVVTDAPLRPAVTEADTSKIERKNSKGNKKKKLAPYVTYLTIKSRPVFTSVICFLLALTTVITFVFLGTFIVSFDSTSAKRYDDSAFTNGDPTRIVILKPDHSAFTNEELDKLLNISHVEKVEKWGSICDTNYYYRENVDYRKYKEFKESADYHPTTNPGGLYLIDIVGFLDNSNYMSTVPMTGRNIVKEGKAPVGMYEVLSADPNHQVGDKVTVYIRNRKVWAQTAYIGITVDVVGKTNYGSGLYFSEEMANFINTTTVNRETYFMPYEAGRFEIPISTTDVPELSVDQVLLPGDISIGFKGLGNNRFFFFEDETLRLVHTGVFNCTHTKIYLVNNEVYEKYMPQEESNQASVHIKDYSYTDRVIKSLSDRGYLTVSPYRVGNIIDDAALARERVVTLAVCIAAFVLTVILQLILMKAMFNSVTLHYKLMSNIGLTASVAYVSLAFIMLIFTMVGEAVGLGVISILNASGFSYVVAIFKYFDFSRIMLLILAHFVLCAFSLLSIYKTLKKQVFAYEKSEEDIDFSSMEEVENID